MTKRKSGLGNKGVEVLLGSKTQEKLKGDGVLKIALKSINLSPYQPRKNFKKESLDSLVDSIKAQGVIQPILVREVDGQKYELIAGERRVRAVKKLGHKTIPAVVKKITDKDAALQALIENIQREDLNPIEEAMSFKKISELYSLTHDQISQVTGKSRTHISNIIRLLQLDDYVKKLLVDGMLDMGHARALLSLSSDKQKELAKNIVNNKLTVRDVELLTSSPEKKIRKGASSKKPSHILNLESELSSLLGVPVEIQFSEKKKNGKLIIKYSGLNVLDGVLEKLGYSK
ncbi:MAG: chromosome partitioning protein ParB [Gammaproteobacteria bacterium]|nr:chromosome partitioning protein ParB [Gammaproteobacteria bacterium]|tara:strand:- start:1038 stop:1901 length:864 start_codon:yes stop_codon:yes gene_type:complete